MKINNNYAISFQGTNGKRTKIVTKTVMSSLNVPEIPNCSAYTTFEYNSGLKSVTDIESLVIDHKTGTIIGGGGIINPNGIPKKKVDAFCKKIKPIENKVETVLTSEKFV